MKMYIAVLDEFPDYMTPTLVAHSVLLHDMENYESNPYDTFIESPYELQYKEWKFESFKKVVVRVSQKEFDKITLLDNVTIHHENNTLGAKKACAVVVVDEDIPNVLKYAKLWKPKERN